MTILTTGPDKNPAANSPAEHKNFAWIKTIGSRRAVILSRAESEWLLVSVPLRWKRALRSKSWWDARGDQMIRRDR